MLIRCKRSMSSVAQQAFTNLVHGIIFSAALSFSFYSLALSATIDLPADMGNFKLGADTWKSILNIFSSPDADFSRESIERAFHIVLAEDTVDAQSGGAYYSGLDAESRRLGITFANAYPSAHVFCASWVYDADERVKCAWGASPPPGGCFHLQTIESGLRAAGWREEYATPKSELPVQGDVPPSAGFDKKNTNIMIFFTRDGTCFTGLEVTKR